MLKAKKRFIKLITKIATVGSYIHYRAVYKNVASNEKELIVHPDSIRYIINDKELANKNFGALIRYNTRGLIFAGPFWGTKVPFPPEKEYWIYTGIKEHFIDHIDWIDTSLFKTAYKSQLRKEGIVKGYNSLIELADDYKKYDKIYDDIRKNGIRSANDYATIDPMSVYIDADGSFIWTSNGNHRLCMATVLGLNEMPVKVWARHKEWQKKRDELLT